MARSYAQVGVTVENKSDTFSICACQSCAGAMLIFSVSFQFLRMTSLEVPFSLGPKLSNHRPGLVRQELWVRKPTACKRLRGRAGIEPATSCTQSGNHTTRPKARKQQCPQKHALRDSNPQLPDSKSDALSIAPQAPFIYGPQPLVSRKASRAKE